MTSVLVVDDDPPLRRALVRDLRANGYQVEAASGYEEAMTSLHDASFDVLLTDLRMAGKGGLDLILAATRAAPELRPIMMSAYATAEDSQRAIELGAAGVLFKPFESEQLLHAVERAVGVPGGFSGTLHGLSLVGLLRMFHLSRRSLTLVVHGHAGASISLDHGKLVDARFGDEVGRSALRRILELPSGVVETTDSRPDAITLSEPFEPLVLDVLHAIGDRRREVDPSSGAARPGELEASAPPSQLSRLCGELIERVPGATFCGVVDRDSHSVLAARCAGGTLPPPRLDAPGVLDSLREFVEVEASSGDAVHVAKRVEGVGAAVVLFAERGADIALARRALDDLIAQVEPQLAALPDRARGGSSAPSQPDPSERSSLGDVPHGSGDS